MTSPLAILFYEDLMPGTQLVHRLQDLRYRVQVVATGEELLTVAATAGPMLIVGSGFQTRRCLRSHPKLRATPTTVHIPLIAFADEAEDKLQSAAKQQAPPWS